MAELDVDFIIRLLAKPDQALYRAAAEGTCELANALIRSGYNINKKHEEDGTVPIHAAAVCGQTDIVDLLMKEGANVRSKDDFGYEPLHYAAFNGHQETVNLLIAYGASVEVKNNNGESPIDLARQSKHKKIVRKLLQCKPS